MLRSVALCACVWIVGCSNGSSGGAHGGAAGTGAGTGGSGVGGSGTGTGGETTAGGSTGTGGNVGTGGGGTVPGGVRWVGRVDVTNPDAVRFAWQGAGFVATMTGPTVSVKLQTTGTPTVFFQPVVDGAPATRFEVPQGGVQTITIASNLGAGDHLIELYRDTEGMYGVSTFSGFAAGTVKGAPAFNGRLVEVVGDSISAGYGDLGVEPHPGWVANPACHWSAANSTWYLTYAAVAGHALDAQVSTIARSGWGMRWDANCSTSGVLSSVYTHAVGTDDATLWGFDPKASVVVINLGTNDISDKCGDPGTPYETAYVSFIQTVRSKYPDAWVFCTIGSMLGDPKLGIIKGHLANIVATVNDPKVITFDFGTQNLGSDGSVPTGCDWHPNVADHARMAGILRTQLSTNLGW